jgi:hypothetical protein
LAEIRRVKWLVGVVDDSFVNTRIPGSPPVVPPPPAGTNFSYGTSSTGPRIGPWENRLVILGVIWLFPVFLTIPGWMALKRYRRWRAGELKRPNVILVWGLLMSTLMLMGAVVQVTGMADETGPSTSAAVVGPDQHADDPQASNAYAKHVVGPPVGQCGTKVGDQLRWTPGAACAPTDEVIVLEVQALPHTPRHGPVRTAAVKLAAARCPTGTQYYTAYVANVACWGRR